MHICFLDLSFTTSGPTCFLGLVLALALSLSLSFARSLSQTMPQRPVAQGATAGTVDAAAWVEAAHEASQQLVRRGSAPCATLAPSRACARARAAGKRTERLGEVRCYVQPIGSSRRSGGGACGSCCERSDQDLGLGRREAGVTSESVSCTAVARDGHAAHVLNDYDTF